MGALFTMAMRKEMCEWRRTLRGHGMAGWAMRWLGWAMCCGIWDVVCG
jgi:hypothetical protein